MMAHPSLCLPLTNIVLAGYVPAWQHPDSGPCVRIKRSVERRFKVAEICGEGIACIDRYARVIGNTDGLVG